ncbi:MAG TPA: hypothetical protein VLW88_05585 [Hyphomicrobium sp.]|nr:hypothetical protein [Hyphomicrobium sp.]
MLKDGIYGLAYAAEGERMPTEGSALATLRKGRIFGSDPWGGVFTGSCQFDADWRLNRVQLRLEVPPDGQLITGFSAGPGGASLDIEGAFEGAAPRLSTVVEVAGRPVRVELTYLGPLPA